MRTPQKRALMGIALTMVVLSGPAWYGYQNNENHRMIRAIKKGDVGTVKSLLDNGVDPNSTEYDWIDVSDTPILEVAVDHGQYEIVKLLLDKGANINAKDAYGETALSSASFNGNFDIV